jgi:hypothetical protein
MMDYKVPFMALIKHTLCQGRIPLLPNYVGHIGKKPVYDVNGPLEAIDDVPIHTERGVGEVTTEEWGNLKGYPASWGESL